MIYFDCQKQNKPMSKFRAQVLLLIAALIIASCGHSKYVTFSVTQPAEITLPSEVNTILLIDRTKFDNKMLNTIEGILTGELPGDDRAAAQEALNSLSNKLGYSPRYSVKILPDRFAGNSMTSAFPQTIPWNRIDSLCKTNNADVVVALEVFDSNFIITHGSRQKKKTESDGKNTREVAYTEYYAQGIGSVKMGLRSYYNKERRIIDQQMIDKKNTWEATGTTALDAAAALISKSQANKHLAKMIGEDYAYKISPMPISVSRSFFGKSKHVSQVETGTRYADVNKWNEAINEWKMGIPKAEEKDAGRLAYNIAVGYEVLGEYGSALTWAQDAYTKYGNKEARDYVRVLEYRIEEEKRLKVQMGTD
jgi:hypothetical protein